MAAPFQYDLGVMVHKSYLLKILEHTGARRKVDLSLYMWIVQIISRSFQNSGAMAVQADSHSARIMA